MENKEQLLQLKKAVFDNLLQKKQQQFESTRNYQRSQLSSINEADLDRSEHLESQTENMMQEMRVESESLDHLENEINQIKQIQSYQVMDKVAPLTVVKTSMGNFVVCVPQDTFDVNGEEYRGISKQSPLYQALQGKGKGDKLDFNGQNVEIKELV